jgi:ATP-dependent DNA ligase
MVRCAYLRPADALRAVTHPQKLANRHYIAKPKLDGQRAQLHIHQGETVARL